MSDSDLSDLFSRMESAEAAAEKEESLKKSQPLKGAGQLSAVDAPNFHYLRCAFSAKPSVIKERLCTILSRWSGLDAPSPFFLNPKP